MSLKSMFSAKDMTIGSPWKRIMEFSIPMLLGNIAQQLYNTADSVIVGIYVGDNALAAVGSAAPILNLLDTPDSIIDWCTSYLNIYFLGIIGFFFYNMLSGILRGLGDSVTALGFLLVSAALNVALDLLLVKKMGVAGVALATAIAQAISAVLCYLKLRTMRDIFDMRVKYTKLQKDVSKRILTLGLPSGITQAIMASAGMVVMNLTNQMGEMVVACNVVV